MIHILSKRRVCVNNQMSDLRDVTVGVPEGSIFWPLLFPLYVNDLPCYLSKSNDNMFADDTKFIRWLKLYKGFIC